MSRVFAFLAVCAIGYLFAQPKQARPGTDWHAVVVRFNERTAEPATIIWTSRDGSVTWSEYE